MSVCRNNVFGLHQKPLELAINIHNQITPESLYISIGNDVTSYLRPAAMVLENGSADLAMTRTE